MFSKVAFLEFATDAGLANDANASLLCIWRANFSLITLAVSRLAAKG